MDDFTASILTLYDNINEMQAKSKINKDLKILNNYLIEKQYLAYYIYRLWIKYRRIMEYTNTPSEFNKVLTYLNIPPKYFKYNVTFPMQDKMVSNEKQLDLIILNILSQFNKCTKYFTNIQKTKTGISASSSTDTISNNNTKSSKIDLYTEEGQYKQLTTLLKDKSIKVIVNDIQMLKILVPNLSKPSGRISVWEIIKPFINISNNLNNSKHSNIGSSQSPSKPSNTGSSQTTNIGSSNTGSSQTTNSRPSNTGSSNTRPSNSYFNPKTSASGQNISSTNPPTTTGYGTSNSRSSNSIPINSRPINSYFNPKTSTSQQPQGNISQQPQGNMTQQLQGNMTQQPQGNMTQQPQGNMTQQPQGNMTQQPQGNMTQQPQGNMTRQPQGNTV